MNTIENDAVDLTTEPALAAAATNLSADPALRSLTTDYRRAANKLNAQLARVEAIDRRLADLDALLVGATGRGRIATQLRHEYAALIAERNGLLGDGRTTGHITRARLAAADLRSRWLDRLAYAAQARADDQDVPARAAERARFAAVAERARVLNWENER